MNFSAILLLIAVYFFASVPAFAAPVCENYFGATSFEEVAQGLLTAIKEKRSGSFPAEVEGKSIIPPEILEGLGDVTRDAWGKKTGEIRKIESIDLEIWHGKDFVIAVKYYKNKDQKITNLGTFKEEFYIWRNYLKKTLDGKANAVNIEIDNLPSKKRRGFTAQLKEKNTKRVKENEFNTERTLGEYKEIFYGQLAPILAKFRGRDKVWIDMGAGSAHAQISVLKSLSRKEKQEDLPTFFAIGYEHPKGEEYIRKIEAKYGGKFAYVTGMQSAASIRRMAQADLITDICGIHCYTENRVGVVNAYIRILKPGGTILINSTAVDGIEPGLLKQVEIVTSERHMYTVITKKD